MGTKIVKKRKIKVFNFFLTLLIITGLSFGVYYFLKLPVLNLVVEGNSFLNDDVILELGGVDNYPKFFITSSKSVEKKLEKSPYIKKAHLKKEWGLVFRIIIEENKALFFDENTQKYVFDDSTGVSIQESSLLFRVPRLLNYVPDVRYQKFIENMGKVKDDTLSKIGDIEYKPNDYDKDRFLLYMDDGNMVYLTLTKFKMINHYNDVLQQLEGHHGILYLDNGNHFKIME